MRFVVTGEWRKNHLLQTIIVLFLIYVVLLWLTNALLYFSNMGLSYRSVVEHYLGSEARFLQPKSYRGLLETAHFHLFAMGILLLTLTHLVLFAPIRAALKTWLIVVPFLAALADEAAGWLVRFVNPRFAYLKIGAFLTLEASLAALVAIALWAVFTGSQNNYAENSSRANNGERQPAEHADRPRIDSA